ncbi:hypothetical protein PYW08_010292 [Mythimna loreyi]|uniref:Uncharacterized protein n=1 Tax=Mythimna loreyi TaxID=667449 RepID=A0ACC2Q4B8_9NEOP|nr:hypothetical protein PYW08_010292 [Mythimna loreyi]
MSLPDSSSDSDGGLYFDPHSILKLILNIGDAFNIRVIMCHENTSGEDMIAVSLRDIWWKIEDKLSQLYVVVFDFLYDQGLKNYKNMDTNLSLPVTSRLCNIIVDYASDILSKEGMEICSCLNDAE